MELNTLISDLKNMLSESRFNHSMGVLEFSKSLAEHFGIDEYKTAVAAVLHDCAKEFDDETMRFYFDKAGIKDPLVIENKKLWHGIAGAYFAKEKYGIDDEIFDAIFYHTLGKENMSPITKIIYLADNIEPCRDNKFPEARAIRKVAFENIDNALIQSINHTLNYIISKGEIIHPNVILIRNSLILNQGDNHD